MLKFKGKRICAACSGGEDSACLLHFLKSREKQDGFILSAVHVEHGIRGEESKADAAFVEQLCKENGIPLFMFSADCLALAKTEKISVETAARQARYAAFESLLNGNKTDYIATAHHAGDEAETVLFHLLRGASLTGAGGMKEECGSYIRPFLFRTKAEISAYAKAHDITFRVDKTNFILDATRNKLRLNVLPLLEETVPGAAENLTRFAQIARADDEYLYRLAKRRVRVERVGANAVRPNTTRAFVKIPSGKSAERQSPLFFRACIAAMKELGLTRDYTYAHLRSLLNLCSLQTGAEIALPRGVRAGRRYNEIMFFKAESAAEKRENRRREEREEIIFRYGETALCGAKICITNSMAAAEEFLKRNGGNGEKILYADGEKLRGGTLRFQRAEDTFEKFGGGRKSLKKYLTNRKIPAEERKKIPLICKGNEVLAIFGTEISDGVKCTENTREKAYLAVYRGATYKD